MLGFHAIGGNSIRLPGYEVSAQQNERGGWSLGAAMVTEAVEGLREGRSGDSKAGSAFGVGGPCRLGGIDFRNGRQTCGGWLLGSDGE